MVRRILFAFALAIGLASAALADEPQVYYFGASGCEYCENGLKFLKRLQAADARLKLTSFDIIADEDDAGVFVALARAIGLSDPQVPMTVIGHHVLIGFESDETTGSEIAATLEACRQKSCPDVVRLLLKHGDAETVSNDREWVIERWPGKPAARPR